MSELKDQPIEQGVRKRTDYDNSRRASMALNVPRQDGGTLRIPVEQQMRSHEEEENIQQNTFLAVVPMGRLPGYDKLGEAPKGAVLRPGRLYVFCQGKLWRELESDGQGQLFEVDVPHWRKIAKAGGEADERKPVGAKQYLLLLPMLLQGRFVGDQYEMAYSELPWTWEYIEWLEASSGRIKQRCQNVAPAWSAAVVGPEQWKATQAMPIIPLTRLSKGLCARELHFETLLEDPLIYTSGLTELPVNSLVNQLQQRHQELAAKTQGPAPEPLPPLPENKDLLNEYQLRGYPRLVGIMLHDPIFALRHAVAQTKLCTELLQTLNALVPHQSFGRYAEVLYQEMLTPAGSLKEFRDHVDLAALKKATLHDEREQAREQLYRQQERLLALTQQLQPAWQDYVHSKDERLLEPYVQLVELLEVLTCSPKSCDPRCIEPADTKVAKDVEKLSKQLVQATHALTRDLLPQADKLPKALERLEQHLASGQPIRPERLGLSALSFLNGAYIAQNMAAATDEVLNHVATATMLAIKRITESPNVTQVELHRSFLPTFKTLKHLHSQAKGLELLPQGKALLEHKVVLGVHGGGVSFGITAAERLTLTRNNYYYANLTNRGRTVATSSAKAAERLGFASKDLGKVMVVVAEANDPLVEDFRQWRSVAPRLDTAKALANSKTIPILATVCAAYSLYANTVGTKELINSEAWRFRVGAGGALIDLGLAANNLALKLLTDAKRGAHPWHVFWERGRFNTSGFWAKNLMKRTGNHWLNLSRIGSAAAMAVTATLFAWDAYRAFRDGDNEVAIANMVAASGAGVWALYTIGIIASPWLLGIGVTLLLAGVVGTVLMAASPLEQAIKHGPFGRQQRLEQMNDPLQAYQQLLGIMGAPVVRIERMAQWREQASEDDRQRLQVSQQEQRVVLSTEDWAVEIASPLLGQFRNGLDFNLLAWERLRTRSHFSGWNNQRPIKIDKEKLGAVLLKDNRLLFVLPAMHQMIAQRDPRRNLQTIQYGLKVCAQFHLGEAMCYANDPFPGYNRITLPQPTPRQWQPYSPGLPADLETRVEAAYWLISKRDFADQ
ncbi:hypothetical protein VUJ49_25435 [Pseudomonas berkeleyensis]|uniref:Uncharacterized protein n=1 Tax=Pseudomonas berkeleyensis TaxID=2726956 RepID=A0A7G5DNH2_9PSED|nr:MULTISPECIES: hypothetical protein [Pseudomonas]QMV63297.1 hypothetical protein HS968_25335 [Pseudomonas berkeleyensis]UYP30627.1 hypothetical protein OEG79_00610 [Pseudomonas sp. Z8(2022)]WSO38754.1 hypothetical protein VUJ49_25435 [Pseudomonas berkeleyensis]